AVMGVLGAAVTALIGARQLFKLHEDWIRFSRTLVDLHAEAVAYSVGSPPYDDEVTAAARLATNVERLVAAETAQWSTLREQHEPSTDPTH
ncbi:MAG: SLATT domain-containing protein, partial [Gammaproteobacteria bacterium]